MRAWEFYEAEDELGVERYDDAPEHQPNRRTPVISLRHIHRLAAIKAAQRREMEHRKIVMGLMYAVKDEDEPSPIQKKQDQIDLRKKELELKKLEQEIHDAERQWEHDLHRLAGNGIRRMKNKK